MSFSACSEDDGNEKVKPLIECVSVPGRNFTGGEQYRIWVYSSVFVPERNIQINQLYAGKYEITKDEYKTVMSNKNLNTLELEADPSYTSLIPETYPLVGEEIDAKRPVENVTWFDAIYFCNLLSKKEKLNEVYVIKDSVVNEGHISSANVTADFSKNGWRLPTEVEWEYIARGGDPDSEAWMYHFSGSKSSKTSGSQIDSALDKCGWYRYNSATGKYVYPIPAFSEGEPGFGTHQVGMKDPNTLGTCDMSGNVFEWCWDWENTVTSSTPLTGPAAGSNRIRHGGSWRSNDSTNCLVSLSNRCTPADHNDITGFRVVRNVR